MAPKFQTPGPDGLIRQHWHVPPTPPLPPGWTLRAVRVEQEPDWWFTTVWQPPPEDPAVPPAKAAPAVPTGGGAPPDVKAPPPQPNAMPGTGNGSTDSSGAVNAAPGGMMTSMAHDGDDSDDVPDLIDDSDEILSDGDDESSIASIDLDDIWGEFPKILSEFNSKRFRRRWWQHHRWVNQASAKCMERRLPAKRKRMLMSDMRMLKSHVQTATYEGRLNIEKDAAIEMILSLIHI